jgi:hypothetical protein
MGARQKAKQFLLNQGTVRSRRGGPRHRNLSAESAVTERIFFRVIWGHCLPGCLKCPMTPVSPPLSFSGTVWSTEHHSSPDVTCWANGVMGCYSKSSGHTSIVRLARSPTSSASEINSCLNHHGPSLNSRFCEQSLSNGYQVRKTAHFLLQVCHSYTTMISVLPVNTIETRYVCGHRWHQHLLQAT